jgi:hypothetical protein
MNSIMPILSLPTIPHPQLSSVTMDLWRINIAQAMGRQFGRSFASQQNHGLIGQRYVRVKR